MSPGGVAASSSSRKRVFLHIGEPKTGTTFLQLVMWTNRAELAAQGIVYPGSRSNAHWRASQDVLEVRQDPGDPAPPFTGEWAKLVEQALTARKAAVISHELLAAANRAQARRALQALDGHEVHLVITVRDLGSLLPAEWQETVKHGNGRRWVKWVEAVMRERRENERGDTGFWRVHDTMRVIDDWAQDVIPPERVHVIMMPSRTAPVSLWDRFAHVAGIDTSMVDTTRARANASLGVAEVEFIRRLNVSLRDDYPGWSYQWFVKDTIAHATLPQREMSPRLQMFPDLGGWVDKQTDRLVDALELSDYDIVGDLDELRRRPIEQPYVVPAEVGDGQLLDTALYAMTGLLDRMDIMRDTINELEQRLDGTTFQTRPVEYIPQYSPLKNKLIALTEEYPVLGRARQRYWRVARAARRARHDARKLRSLLSADKPLLDPSTVGLPESHRVGSAKGAGPVGQ